MNLPAINIALAQEAGHGDLLAPCAACFNRTKAADPKVQEAYLGSVVADAQAGGH